MPPYYNIDPISAMVQKRQGGKTNSHIAAYHEQNKREQCAHFPTIQNRQALQSHASVIPTNANRKQPSFCHFTPPPRYHTDPSRQQSPAYVPQHTSLCRILNQYRPAGDLRCRVALECGSFERDMGNPTVPSVAHISENACRIIRGTCHICIGKKCHFRLRIALWPSRFSGLFVRWT